jgi:hypothetical protein
MATKKILFIEGEPNTPNGDLRQGFAKLLGKRIEGQLPRINLGGGKSQTVRKFLKNKFEADAFLLLIDLDRPEEEKEQDIKDNDLFPQRENVFYMVLEMESWFLSQPMFLMVFLVWIISRKKYQINYQKEKLLKFPTLKAN